MSTEVETREGRGWTEFAAVIMFAVGAFRVIGAIGAFSSSHRIIDLRTGLFGHHFWIWGAEDLVIAALAFAVGVSLLRGGAFGRLGGYLWGAAVIVQSFTLIRLAPAYGTLSIVIAGFVIYALSRAD